MSEKIVTFEEALGAGAIRGKLPPDYNPQRVLSARKLSRWLNFSEERAGRPWNPEGARGKSA